MTGQETSDRNRVRLCPPPPKDFDPFTATEEDLKRHVLPLRPDPQTQRRAIACCCGGSRDRVPAVHGGGFLDCLGGVRR